MLLSLGGALLACAPAHGQGAATGVGRDTITSGMPAIVTEILASLGPSPTFAMAVDSARAIVWRFYPEGEAPKRELLAFLPTTHKGRIGFAALALVPYHDPATVRPILDQALQDSISPETRWMLINVAPFVLSNGAGFTWGWKGQLDSTARQRVALWNQFADSAVKYGLGREYARRLRLLYDTEHGRTPPNPDYGLALMDLSAQLGWILDLRDADVLDPFLDGSKVILPNILISLESAANHHFVTSLVPGKLGPSVAPEEMGRAAAAGRTWWHAYLHDHPDGDWRPAAIAGFQERGYVLDDDLRSQSSSRALLRAARAPDAVTRFNAYRLLNDIYDVHADLDALFAHGKYALSFMDPGQHEAENETRLCNYWAHRLTGGVCPPVATGGVPMESPSNPAH